MTHSRYGIVVVENIDERSPKSSYFNPNVAIELGYMLALKNRCLILKERAVRTLNTDILQFIYTPFDKFDVRDTVEAAISRWLENLSVFPTRPIEIISSDNALEAEKAENSANQRSTDEYAARRQCGTTACRQSFFLSHLRKGKACYPQRIVP